jgi:hypothetical protein
MIFFSGTRRALGNFVMGPRSHCFPVLWLSISDTKVVGSCSPKGSIFLVRKRLLPWYSNCDHSFEVWDRIRSIDQ